MKDPRHTTKSTGWLDTLVVLVATVAIPRVELWLTQAMEETVPLLVLLAHEAKDYG